MAIATGAQVENCRGSWSSPTVRVTCADHRRWLLFKIPRRLNGDDLRRDPLDVRKATLASVLRRAAPGLRLNEHIEGDGPTVFVHACKLGLEGIVSKRRDSGYRSGRSPHWIKSKNPQAAAARREAEEDWGRWPSARSRHSSR
jgi:ATP-dependent DNA ligase